MSEDIGQLEALDALADYVQRKIRTLLPAIVETYDPIRNVATVKLGRLSKTSAGALYGPETLPDLEVEWPRGGGWTLRWELQPLDEVELAVFDRDPGPWLEAGGIVEPTGGAMHSLANAVVRPMISSAANPLPGGDGSLYLGRDDGTATIEIDKAGGVTIEGLTLKLGATAVEAVTLATALQTFLVAASAAAATAAVIEDGGAAAFGSFGGTMAGLAAAAGAVKAKAE